MNAKQKPDINMDITSTAFDSKLENDFNKFQSIICEYLGEDFKKTFPLKKHLQDKGNMVYVGFQFDLFENLPLNTRIWVGIKEDSDIGVTIIIIPNNTNELKLGAGLHGYLQKFFSKKDFIEDFHQITIDEQIKLRAKQLDNFLNRKSQLPYRVVMQALQNQNNPEAAISVRQLKELAQEYKPGFFRRHIGSGKTKGMEELENFLNKFDDKHVLTDAELEELFNKILQRQVRINNSRNPTRKPTGQTSQIYDKVAVLILSHFAGKPEKVDLKEEPRQILPKP